MTEEEQIEQQVALIQDETNQRTRRWKWTIAGIALILVSGITLLVGAALYAMLKSNEQRDETCEALVVFVKNARRLSTSVDSPNRLTRTPDQLEAINKFYNDLLDGLSCYNKEEDSVRQS